MRSKKKRAAADDLVTTPAAAKLVGCTAEAILQRVRGGRLKPFRQLESGAYLFLRRDIERIRRERRARLERSLERMGSAGI